METSRKDIDVARMMGFICVATATKRSQEQGRARITGRSVKKSDRSAVETHAMKEDLNRVREDSLKKTVVLKFSSSS